MAARAVGAIVVLTALGTPTLAQAAEVGYSQRPGTGLEYIAGSGEQNQLFVSADGDRLTFRDTAGVRAGPRCEQLGPDEARCPRPTGGDPIFDVRLADGSDRAEVDGAIPIRVYGGPGDDVLLGGTSAPGDLGEYLIGEGGDDELRGRAGTEGLLGREGDDVLAAGDGHADLRGHAGRDELVGGSDRDLLNGGGDEDELSGGGGDDFLEGRNHVDSLDGGAGDDTLKGNRGSDRLVSGDGDDRAFGGPGDDRVNGDGGGDHLSGNGGEDVIGGDTGNDRIFGGEGEDELGGEEGDDFFGTIERDSLGGELADDADGVVCGEGADSVRSAPPDLLDDECERALLWNTLVGLPPEPAIEDDAAVFSVSCGDPAGCHGEVTLSLPEPGRVLGTARIDLSQSEDPVEVRVPLTSEDVEVLRQGALIEASFLEDEVDADGAEGYRIEVSSSAT